MELGLNQWAKFADDASGQEYYHNASTGETTYTRPQTYATPRDGQLPSGTGLNGWAKFTDDGSGQDYYYHAATQETTFERPSDFTTPRAGQRALVVAPITGDTAGWEKHYDESSQQFYYYNQ